MKRSINFLSICAIIIFSLNIGQTESSAKYYHDNKDNVYVHKNTEEKLVALTFDDGPHEVKTEKILAVLDKYKVKATFFVIGQNAEKNPQLVKKAAELGHEIGNHTYDHKSIYKLSGEILCEDVEKCSNVIKGITGKKPKLFRPPEGFMNDTIASAVAENGYDVILWKVDTYDWKGKSAAEISSNVIRSVKSGDIILMHDYIWRQSHTDQALDIIIPQLLERGYKFVTVSELIDK